MDSYLPCFTYRENNSISVAGTTKQHIMSNDLEEDITYYGFAYLSLGDTIPFTHDNITSGHTFPWQESWNEIQISYNLCSLGFYKQSLASLRAALELGLLSAFYVLQRNELGQFRDWLRSRENTPFFNSIWKRISLYENVVYFESSYDLKTRILKLGYLHNYVHTKGLVYSNFSHSGTDELKINPGTQQFNSDYFNVWFFAFKEIIEVVSILHLVVNPISVYRCNYWRKFGLDKPWVGGLEEHEIERLNNIVGDDIFKKIEVLKDFDTNTKELINWIESHPDLSDEELESQIIDCEKSQIEHLGLNIWLESYLSREKLYISEDELKLFHQRKNELTQWANINGFILPFHLRNK